MLNLAGRQYKLCDGLSRRTFMQIGAAGFGSLTLADLLRAEDAQGIGSSNKSIINIHLDGGPPQMDTIDMKPNAPVEIRGPFQSIATNMPGFRVCEYMPRIATIADRFTHIRSLVGADGQHNAFQCMSGFKADSLKSVGGRPAMGSLLTKIMPSSSADVPTFVDMMQGRPLVRNSARPGFLGPSFGPFRPDMSAMFKRPLEEAMKGELAALGENHTTEMRLNESLDVRRIHDRQAMLAVVDGLRRRLDANRDLAAMDRFHDQAVDILLSGRFADAMDLDREDKSIVERYLPPASAEPFRQGTNDEPRATLKLLLARRLVEAGVRCVSVSLSDFDTHSHNFPRMKQLLPIFDHGLWALMTDLEERGLIDDVSVVVWGEFGRTPKVNKEGGRDHWPAVSIAMLAGGGMRVGQVLGATDKHAASVLERPIHYQDVMATLYRNLGIDARKTTVIDPSGRPQYLLDRGEAIKEV